jgi:hypothetical protein
MRVGSRNSLTSQHKSSADCVDGGAAAEGKNPVECASPQHNRESIVRARESKLRTMNVQKRVEIFYPVLGASDSLTHT